MFAGVRGRPRVFGGVRGRAPGVRGCSRSWCSRTFADVRWNCLFRPVSRSPAHFSENLVKWSPASGSCGLWLSFARSLPHPHHHGRVPDWAQRLAACSGQLRPVGTTGAQERNFLTPAGCQTVTMSPPPLPSLLSATCSRCPPPRPPTRPRAALWAALRALSALAAQHLLRNYPNSGDQLRAARDSLCLPTFAPQTLFCAVTPSPLLHRGGFQVGFRQFSGGFPVGFRLVSGWLQVGFRWASGGFQVASGWPQVGVRSASGVSGWLQVGVRWVSGWFQVGCRRASGGLQVGFWLVSIGFQVGFRGPSG